MTNNQIDTEGMIRRYLGGVTYDKIVRDVERARTKDSVVFTVAIGDYDRCQSIHDDLGRVDFLAFSTCNENVLEPWQNIGLPKRAKELGPFRYSRLIKILAYRFLKGYSRAIYIDGNIEILSDPYPLFEKHLNGATFAIRLHPSRNCIYEEGAECIRSGKASRLSIRRQLMDYAERGMPRHFGMTENCIILYDLQNDKTRELCDAWWEEYLRGSIRDQISLPFAQFKTGLLINRIDDPTLLSKDFEPDRRTSFVRHDHIRKTWRKKIVLLLRRLGRPFRQAKRLIVRVGRRYKLIRPCE